MLRWSLRLMIGILMIALAAVVTGPLLLYAVGLAKIDGRPSHASDATVTPEDVAALWKTLRMPQPDQIEPLSPYSYLYALLHRDDRVLGPGARVAWPIARSHNAEHLTDPGHWHLSGAALTIWLTRNWTMNELVAKAVELEKAAANARATRRAGYPKE